MLGGGGGGDVANFANMLLSSALGNIYIWQCWVLYWKPTGDISFVNMSAKFYLYYRKICLKSYKLP